MHIIFHMYSSGNSISVLALVSPHFTGTGNQIFNRGVVKSLIHRGEAVMEMLKTHPGKSGS